MAFISSARGAAFAPTLPQSASAVIVLFLAINSPPVIVTSEPALAPPRTDTQALSLPVAVKVPPRNVI